MEQVLSVSEACAIAHMGRTSFYQALHSGALTARKRGSRTFVLASELQRFIDSLPELKVKPPSKTGGIVFGHHESDKSSARAERRKETT